MAKLPGQKPAGLDQPLDVAARKAKAVSCLLRGQEFFFHIK